MSSAEDRPPVERGDAVARPCPICGRPAAPAVRPFCSKRCADVDLHRWLGGVYAIPVKDADDPVPDEENEGEDPAGNR